MGDLKKFLRPMLSFWKKQPPPENISLYTLPEGVADLEPSFREGKILTKVPEGSSRVFVRKCDGALMHVRYIHTVSIVREICIPEACLGVLAICNRRFLVICLRYLYYVDCEDDPKKAKIFRHGPRASVDYFSGYNLGWAYKVDSAVHFVDTAGEEHLIEIVCSENLGDVAVLSKSGCNRYVLITCLKECRIRYVARKHIVMSGIDPSSMVIKFGICAADRACLSVNMLLDSSENKEDVLCVAVLLSGTKQPYQRRSRAKLCARPPIKDAKSARSHAIRRGN